MPGHPTVNVAENYSELTDAYSFTSSHMDGLQGVRAFIQSNYCYGETQEEDDYLHTFDGEDLPVLGDSFIKFDGEEVESCICIRRQDSLLWMESTEKYAIKHVFSYESGHDKPDSEDETEDLPRTLNLSAEIILYPIPKEGPAWTNWRFSQGADGLTSEEGLPVLSLAQGTGEQVLSVPIVSLGGMLTIQKVVDDIEVATQLAVAYTGTTNAGELFGFPKSTLLYSGFDSQEFIDNSNPDIPPEKRWRLTHKFAVNIHSPRAFGSTAVTSEIPVAGAVIPINPDDVETYNVGGWNHLFRVDAGVWDSFTIRGLPADNHFLYPLADLNLVIGVVTEIIEI